MLLAAGLGTRLRSLGLEVPKALVEVAGQPLLGRQLDYLAREGARRVVVNAHHMAAEVQDFVQRREAAPETVVVVEPELLGTAGAVRNALEHLGPDAFVVLYGDVMVDEPLEEMLDAHAAAGVAATIAVYESADAEGKGTLRVDSNGLVEEFAEKADHGGGSVLINAGLYVVEPRLVAGLLPGQAQDFGYDVFPQALSAGERLLAYRLARPAIDVGTPAGLEAARRAASGR